MILIQIALVLICSVFIQGQPFVKRVQVKDAQFLTKDFEPRIINGKNATVGQFPYQIGMYMDRKNFCGGSIISSNWILTAAHCVDKKLLFSVYFGALDINVPDEPGRIIMDTRTSRIHEGYNRSTLDNDVGLVKLDTSVPLNPQINPIQLPPRSFNDKDWVGQPVRVSGWGKLTDEDTWIAPRLQFVDLTVISNAECSEIYGETFSEKIVCAAGPDGKSTCNGDSGGPLVIIDEETKKVTHFAVVSFVSDAGCASGSPSGYDRTYKFLDWIHEKTGIAIQD